MRHTAPRARAFTLVETLLASAVLAFVVAAIAQALATGHAQTAESFESLRGSMLADALMEEILAHAYTDPQATATAGPDSGETTRLLYDNLDDFHGYSESAGALRDAANTLLPTAFQKYSRAVTAVYGSATLSGLGGSVTGITITVTVTASPGSATWVVSRFVPESSG